MDVKGNEQADRLAKEGVTNHGVKLQKEQNKDIIVARKINREEEDSNAQPKGKSKGRYWQSQEEVVRKTKIERGVRYKGYWTWGL